MPHFIIERQQPQQLTIEQALHAAMQHHQSGRLPEAEQLYRAILGTQPTHAIANHNLGLIAVHMNNLDVAEHYFLASLNAEPNNYIFLSNFGELLNRKGELDKAEQALRKSLSINPKNLDALTNFGAVLTNQGRLEEAKLALSKAIAINKKSVNALSILGVIYQKTRLFDDVKTIRRKTIQHDPPMNQQSTPIQQQVRIVIFGLSYDVWMQALGPASTIWPRLGIVNEVLMVQNVENFLIPAPVVPGTATVVIPLMEKHIANCPADYYRLIPSLTALEIFSDKELFADYAMRHGLSSSCPRFFPRFDEVEYPAVLKRVDLHAGQGIVVVRNDDDLRRCLQDQNWKGQRLILQSLVPSCNEYVMHAICKDGYILWQTTFEYELDSPDQIRGPENFKAIRTFRHEKETLARLEAFLIPLRYSGPCNVDYKLTASGEPIVFEINPRFGGSLMRGENFEYLIGAIDHLINSALSAS